jgi:hypothetical protein
MLVGDVWLPEAAEPLRTPPELTRNDSRSLGKGRRFLFVMQYPGYLRYFDSTVRLLARRGHHVDVAFDSPHKQPEGIEALDGVENVACIGQTPRRDDVWGVVGKAIRGAVDYLRYLHPRFADAHYLRNRMRDVLPPVFRFLGRWRSASAPTTRRVIAPFLAGERAIPSSAVIERFIKSRQPDAVLITPLVTDRSTQVDLLKSAHALGIPVALCVASWDHLTTKGLMRVQPDLVSVWNQEQLAEAVEFHGASRDRIAVTGAQPFDRWFERQATDRGAFCRKVGLDSARPFVLFVGSTASISSPEAEVEFVRRWIEALRSVPALEGIGILIRPHPYNAIHWRDVDLTAWPGVEVYPRLANPVNEADRQDYFDSLFHSEAVVGVNTTAMIEAAIVGRTVHAVLADEFRDTQGGTLHFRYLLAENGGFLRVATSLSEHATQLAETLANPGIGREACARFVRTFIRPHGINVEATAVLADALEKLAASGRRPIVRVAASAYPLQFILWLGGVIAVYRNPMRIVKVMRRAGFALKTKVITAVNGRTETE